MRQYVARTLGEVDEDATALLWVTDFPMFEWCAQHPGAKWHGQALHTKRTWHIQQHSDDLFGVDVGKVDVNSMPAVVTLKCVVRLSRCPANVLHEACMKNNSGLFSAQHVRRSRLMSSTCPD